MSVEATMVMTPIQPASLLDPETRILDSWEWWAHTLPKAPPCLLEQVVAARMLGLPSLHFQFLPHVVPYHVSVSTFKNIYLSYTYWCSACMDVCLCPTCMPSSHTGQERASDRLEPELEM